MASLRFGPRVLFFLSLGVGAAAVRLHRNFRRGQQNEACADKDGVVRNADVRRFLQSCTLNGPMANHTNYAKFPVKGVYMFQGLGPAALEDFSHARDWDEQANTFELDMRHTIMQSGVDTKYGGIGPYVPGLWMSKIFWSSFMNYKNLFRCPKGPLLDEQRCEIDSSVLGANYTRDQTGTQYFIKHESGRVFERQTTMFESEFHNYKLRRVVDESGQIDEENFEMLMEKLDGQDLVVYRPASP